MRKVVIDVLVTIIVGILAVGICIAGVPGSINYQGKLTDTLGQPVPDGTYQVQFKLYTVDNDPPLFWTSVPQNVTTSGGVFTTQLTPLAASDLAGRTDVWLEILVGSPLVALSPRTKFTSVPYALVSGDSWSLLGNAGTFPGTYFIGTKDNQPLEFKVNNARGFRLEPTDGTPNVIGGYFGNTVSAGTTGATISGGGSSDACNSVTLQYGTVGGGYANTAGGADSPGGSGIGGGVTVGGGYGNAASNYYSTVGGGRGNTANGQGSTVAGGVSNTALGAGSFAAGQRAGANHDGTFVWSDSTTLYPAFFASTEANQFLIRAMGGVGIGVNNPAAALDVNGLIRSRTGGVKFPDGTIQTTAASAASFWGLAGNVGTTSGTNFIGTTDNQPLEFKVNNARGLRLEPTTGTPNIVGGYSGNTVTSGAVGATISGGGASSHPNSVTVDYGTVGGGYGNTVGYLGTVGGGISNTTFSYATVGGGSYNNASNFTSTVGGGSNNTASGSLATVGGGYGNTADGDDATVPGGRSNTASGDWATVGGGNNNTAGGECSFAAGNHAKANHNGTFVWSSAASPDFISTAANQFLIRASGGVGIGTNSPTSALSVAGNVNVTGNIGIGTATPGYPLHFADTVGDKISLSSGWGFPPTSYGFGVRSNLLQIHTSDRSEDVAFGFGTSDAMVETMRIKGMGSVGIGTNNPDTDFRLHVNGLVLALGYYYPSDLRYKTNIETIPRALDKVEKLRGVTFDWKKSEYPQLAFGDGRQVGFVAQEIEQVLPEVVSKDDKGIYSVAYGSVVPLLVEAMKEQSAHLNRLEKLNADQSKRIDELQKLVDEMLRKEKE